MFVPYQLDGVFTIMDKDTTKLFKGFDGSNLTFLRENDAKNFCDARNAIDGHQESKKRERKAYRECIEHSSLLDEMDNRSPLDSGIHESY